MHRVTHLENYLNSGKRFHTTVQDNISATGKFGSGKLRGVCFRISYEWLVATWKGRAFDLGTLDGETVYRKQLAYLDEADTLRGLGYDAWFRNANSLSQTTLQLWGQPHGHACAPPLSSANLATLNVFAADGQGNPPDMAAIIGFFGDQQQLWGHATAYCCRNDVPQCFDINDGIYVFSAQDERPAEMQRWIRAQYCTTDKIRDFVVYPIY